MQVVILAAGQGSRLLPLTSDRPKCLVNVGERSILEYQIDALKKCNINNIEIVTGYHAEKIEETIGRRASYTYNPHFKETNSLYSLWLVKDKIRNDFILLNSDVLFHIAVLEKLIDSHYPDVLAVDSRKRLIDGEMNVRVNEERKIVDISKKIAAKDADAESVQIVKFSKKGATVFLKKVDELISANEINRFPTYAIQQMLSFYNIYALDIGDLPWIEIDELQDLERAKEIIHGLNRKVS